MAAIGMALIAMTALVIIVMWDVSALTLILAGVALNSFMASLTALAINLSPNPFAFNDIMFWLMGSLANRSMNDVLLILPFVAIGWGLLYLAARPLTATVLSDDAAHSLGVNLKGTRILVIAGVAVGVGASIAVSGVIGFVGLVAPHLVRPIFGNDPRRLYWPSALSGALILVGADVLIRLLPNSGNLRIGVMTALLGAPFFAWYLISSRRAIR
jgi:iron complex transport system permease protein